MAVTAVKALVLPPEWLRAVLIAEAELGERIMRALILRRVGLIEAGAGPMVLAASGMRMCFDWRASPTATAIHTSGWTRRQTAMLARSSKASRSMREICQLCFVSMARCCATPVTSNWRAASAWLHGSI
jgi:hypothetical protein